jgi:hypothetical protein
LAVSRETTFTAVTALLVAAHLQKITHLTFAGLASIRSKLLAAAVCAAGLSIKASAGVITATRSVAAQRTALAAEASAAAATIRRTAKLPRRTAVRAE